MIMFKYILFDLDNTIYDYDKSNNKSLDEIFSKISYDFKLDKDILQNEYQKEKKKFQNYCSNASSHNKFIQLKKIFEKYELDLNNLNNYYEIYIKNFYNSLEIYPNLLEFILFCQQNNIKLYILTNNTCREQINRLQKLRIINYFEKIYTSEEFGIEKPDIKLFYYILSDIGCNRNEIVKIGDNYNNDIEPLILNNIYAFWFNKKFCITNTHLEFNSYKSLLNFFVEYYQNLNNYLDISYYVGERFDLVQAGGGNISFKMNEIMFIKSSGCCLSNMDINKNYVGLNYINIRNQLNLINNINKKDREIHCKKIVDSNIIFLKDYKPSIETTLHCLTKKYTMHIHSIQFNCISSLKNCNIILEKLFNNYCLIDYFTPGIDVTLELIKKYENENIIFMKNHGLVITTDNINELRNILNSICNKLESYLQLDFTKYHLVNYISETLQNKFKHRFISYLVENKYIYSYINNLDEPGLIKIFRSFFPDKIVYCGISCVIFKNNLKESIEEYMKKYSEIPKIFLNIKEKLIYISSNSINKCREIEQVLLSHILCYNDLNSFLVNEEINYLNNWDAEKYRKKK